MPRRFLDWVKRRFEKQDSNVTPDSEPRRRRFQPFKRLRDAFKKMMNNLSGILPSWLAGFVIQGALILIGAPWWVWPIIALAAWAMFGGFF